MNELYLTWENMHLAIWFCFKTAPASLQACHDENEWINKLRDKIDENNYIQDKKQFIIVVIFRLPKVF